MRSNGARTCRRLRRQENAAPIIHCRPQGEAEPTDADADIYLVQPFTSRKLLNRIRALLPADPHREEIIRLGHIILYRHKRSLYIAGQGEQRLAHGGSLVGEAKSIRSGGRRFGLRLNCRPASCAGCNGRVASRPCRQEVRPFVPSLLILPEPYPGRDI